MSDSIFDLCSLIRSKNAGPFELTFDFMCRDQSSFDRLVRSSMLTPELFARLFDIDEQRVKLFNHEAALAVKVSIPRPVVQGSLADADCYGGQQYAVVLDSLR
ncbi:DUF4387 domain-containing protein [Rhodococcus sp. 077-4]|uniref:DUF4387 domain-containing protein n=1 Tax=Rhodococcus sp. 077-4 TaxID=2789271 RepID=UPI0039F4B388